MGNGDINNIKETPSVPRDVPSSGGDEGVLHKEEPSSRLHPVRDGPGVSDCQHGVTNGKKEKVCLPAQDERPPREGQGIRREKKGNAVPARTQEKSCRIQWGD